MNNERGIKGRTAGFLVVWIIVAGSAFGLDYVFEGNIAKMAGQNLTYFGLVGMIASILAAAQASSMGVQWVLGRRNKPAAEAMMVSRIIILLAVAAIGISIAYGLGKVATFGTFLSLFGGMFLGWSLQAPVSGFAAWILICLRRPFRPGDRIQFPSLDLTGDIEDIGAMYMTLNQVGGSIASEEAVGRQVLIPNAMLFNNVVINYTVEQEAPYILDEVTVRITYDSNWEKAEAILLNAAKEITGDIIEATGVEPYIRSQLYDYGVYMQLRYQTAVQNRAEIAYKIEKRIFGDIQKEPSVDLAIPYVYSYRAATYEGEREDDSLMPEVQKIPIEKIETLSAQSDPEEISRLSQNIAARGLLHPIVVVQTPDDRYRVVTGYMRLQACRQLGWKTVPALVLGGGREQT